MKDKTTHLYVDSHERTLILHSLVELKNALILLYEEKVILTRLTVLIRRQSVSYTLLLTR